MNRVIVPLAALAPALLCGCYTSEVPIDYTRKANASLAAQEQAPPQIELPELKDRLKRLWRDVPEYAAWLEADRPLKKMPRLVSVTPPAYPMLPLLAGIKGLVWVSFVVGRDGSVQAARILESSDSRFDQSAVEAAMKWKFLPGEFEDGPTIVVMSAPVEFAGKR